MHSLENIEISNHRSITDYRSSLTSRAFSKERICCFVFKESVILILYGKEMRQAERGTSVKRLTILLGDPELTFLPKLINSHPHKYI